MIRYFEDFTVGEVIELGSHTMTSEEMLAFARQFDPQPFHVDEEAARQSPFGGLIASGWHTGSVCMRLLVDNLLNSAASLGSPGLEELRWLKPVRPGDTISPRMSVLETAASERSPDRGTVRWLAEALNQDGEVVMRMVGRNLFARRPSATSVSH